MYNLPLKFKSPQGESLEVILHLYIYIYFFGYISLTTGLIFSLLFQDVQKKCLYLPVKTKFYSYSVLHKNGLGKSIIQKSRNQGLTYTSPGYNICKWELYEWLVVKVITHVDRQPSIKQSLNKETKDACILAMLF